MYWYPSIRPATLSSTFWATCRRSGPAFLGVTGNDGELSKLAREVGAVYFRGEPGQDGSYLVDHTVSIMLIDPRGRLVAMFGMPHDAALIATRFLELERAVLAAG